MQCNRIRPGRRRGVAIVFTVICGFVLLGCAALTIDIGISQIIRTELQRTADAAALSAVEALRGNGDAAAIATGRQQALVSVSQNVILNNLAPTCDGTSDITFGQAQYDFNGNIVGFTPGAFPADTVEVNVHYEQTFTFAQIFGYTSTILNAVARATRMPRTPIAMWRLGENVGINAADETGNHDGTYIDDPTHGMAGVVAGDTAVRFDGSDDFVEVPHDDDFLLDDGAVSVWLNPDGLSASRQGVFSKDSSGYDTGGHLDIHIHDDGDVHARIQSTTQSFNLHSGPAITENAWHHVVVNFGSGGFRMFVNGAEVDSDPYAGGLGTTSGGAGNHEPITLGVGQRGSANQSSAGWDRPFKGKIDEAAIYNRPLTPEEVQWLYDQVIGGTAANGATVRDSLLSM